MLTSLKLYFSHMMIHYEFFKNDPMDLKSQTNSNITEAAVYRRYAGAAHAVENELCCPVDYDRDLLKMLPEEILQRDYGCGDPSAFVREGDTVLDLGSGGGKICYIASQIVGETGRVLGVDCNEEMLALANKYRDEMATKLGYANVEFHRGLIQDLKLDLDRLSERMNREPIDNVAGWLQLRQWEAELRDQSPMIPSDSVDCVVSNCVLNLVRREDRKQMLSEIYRVLKNGGRAAISDIVCDEPVPEKLQRDPKLWSGCLSGAFLEDEFLRAFEEAGFHGIELVKRESQPWQTIEGIEFRSVTVVAWKGKEGPCLERNQALIYKGPFRKVHDDDGHVFVRGERTAVCDKLYHLLQREPYQGCFEPVAPLGSVPLESAKPFDCSRMRRRDPKETKGKNYTLTVVSEGDCCSVTAGGGSSSDEDCC